MLLFVSFLWKLKFIPVVIAIIPKYNLSLRSAMNFDASLVLLVVSEPAVEEAAEQYSHFFSFYHIVGPSYLIPLVV
jgi:hypothetical protein